MSISLTHRLKRTKIAPGCNPVDERRLEPRESSTITNCFRKSGSFKDACIEGDGGATDKLLDIFIVEESILPALDHIKERLTDYFRCDEQLATSEQLSDADNLDQVQASRVSNQEIVKVESDDDQGKEMALVTKKSSLTSIASYRIL